MIEKIKDENEILTLTEELREERLTGECNDIQIWGKKVCKDCPLKDDKIFDNKSNTWKHSCGGEHIRITGRNKKGFIVPIDISQ